VVSELRLLVSALIVGAVTLPAQAQTYPDRTIRIIVPFAAGGSTDIVARTTSQKLSERVRQSVVIDNRGGGGGNIGSDMVAKAAPDGHTLLIGTVGSLTINPALYKTMPYDPLKDLTPIGYIGSTPHLLVVHPSLPTRSVRELIAVAKSKPGEFNYASGGTGGSTHLAAELFKSLTQVNMVHVPHKGGALGMVSLLGGHVHLMFQSMPPVLPHVKSGRLRALGITGSTRSPLLPALPTVAESGLPGYEVTQWWGLLGPSGLPSAIVARLSSELNAILQQADVKERFAGEGADVAPNTPEWFAARLKSESAKWAKIVRASGATAD
jgi:tripartite-type tricarboxylate transporter receptor subunit TctC